jgi:hypothetical protein
MRRNGPAPAAASGLDTPHTVIITSYGKYRRMGAEDQVLLTCTDRFGMQ